MGGIAVICILFILLSICVNANIFSNKQDRRTFNDNKSMKK